MKSTRKQFEAGKGKLKLLLVLYVVQNQLDLQHPADKSCATRTGKYMPQHQCPHGLLAPHLPSPPSGSPPKRIPNWEPESYLGRYLGTWVPLLMPPRL